MQFATKTNRRDGKTVRLDTRVTLARRESVSSWDGSGGCFPNVSMMQATDPRQRFQSRGGWLRLDRSAERCILAEPEVRAVFVIVGDV